MTTIMRRALPSVLSALLLAGAAISPASAQDDPRQFSAAAGEVVNAAMNLADSKNYEAAVADLRTLISKADLNAYERATIYQMIGQYSYELGLNAESQKAFENAITSGGLLPSEVNSLNVVIAQLMIGNGQYREGAERLEQYLASGGVEKPQFLELLLNAWVQTEDYPRALPWAEKWFDTANPKERRHYDLLNFLYNNLGLPERQADIVKQMIDRWPDDKDLWGNWASMLASGGREEDAFEITKLMYLNGLLTTEAELLKVVQYYSFYDMPYQAAQILEQEMRGNRISRSPDQLKQLSTLYRQARDYGRAIPILEDAASLSGEGAVYAELGEALYNEGQCRKSEAAFTEAIDRGYDAGKSWMLIASCRYDKITKLDRLSCVMSEAQIAEAPITKAREAAISAFNNVPRESGEAGNARKWIQFINAEREGFDAKCGSIGNIEKQLCFQKVKQAYDAIVFIGKFELEDENCTKYKAEYDEIYRQTVSQ